MTKGEDLPINILWTSGWDSTFRMIQLARNEAHVQPHYIIDPERKSALVEIKRIQAIKKELSAKYVNCMINDVNFIEISTIAYRQDIVEAYQRILNKAFLGNQIVFLSALSKTINNLEFCVHKDDNSEYFIRMLQNDANHEVDLSDEKLLFGDFKFPILDYTKLDMEKECVETGDIGTLNKSWFCHWPVNGAITEEPCGICNPCKYVIEEGLAKRLPLRARLYAKAPVLMTKIRNRIHRFF